MSVKLLLYCTKAKPYLYGHYVGFDTKYQYDLTKCKQVNFYHKNVLNGKIVAECECEKVESFNCCCVPYRKENNLGYELFVDNGVYKVEWKENINLRNENKQYNNPEIYKNDGVVFERKDRYIDTMLKNDDLGKAKITPQELLDYIGLENEGYALHLSNVKVFDEPKELNEFNLFDPDYCISKELKKAPQNMCRVVEFNGLCQTPSKEYVLISIRPKHLCKILNGEKTIEIRKKILNSLKGLV